MSTLSRDLTFLSFNNKDGGYATQNRRTSLLRLFATQLREHGYKLPSARSIKPKHVEYLVQRWQSEGLGAGTIKNRMCGLRWWAQKVNKASIIPRTNEELGIEARTRSGDDKAQKLDLDKVSALPCERMQMTTRLMAAFGLRMEEALKFRACIADKGESLVLKGSWCKGGRAREIPITLERQRDLLAQAHELVGKGSMIPNDKNYIQHRKAFEHQTLKAGFTNLHGLRHNYAQARYKMLTGTPCPKAGGAASNKSQADLEARQQISAELGHGRLEITKVYLG